MTRPLRIAVIASNRFPLRQPFAGGLESHVWHLARALAGCGHEVSLFAGPGSEEAPELRSLTVRQLVLSEVARSDISMPAEDFMVDHHAYLGLMLDLAGTQYFDVVHNHSLHHLPVAMAPLLQTPMLTTVHTPPTPWLESALRVTGGAGTRLAAVSRHTADSWSGLVEGIDIVPNGIDTESWALGPGGPNLVWFGRITPEKGTHLAIAAARRAGMPLMLAGPVSDPAYYATTVAPELDDTIRYVGHLHQDQLAELVGTAAAALVTPTWDEPYGLVVAEAMSCGTPVVAFARGGIPELVDSCAGQLVPPDDVDAMAAAVREVTALHRPTVRAHARTHCSAQTMLSRYLAAYTTMINDAGSTDDDRLLRPPSGLRSSGAGDEHLWAVDQTGHRPDEPSGARTEFIHPGDRASA